MNSDSSFYTLSTLVQTLATVFSILIAVVTFRIGNIQLELRRRAGTLVKWCRESVMDDGEVIEAWLARDYLEVAKSIQRQLGDGVNLTYMDEAGYLRKRGGGMTSIDSIDINSYVQYIKRDHDNIVRIQNTTKRFLIFSGALAGAALMLLPFSPWLANHILAGGILLFVLLSASLVCLGIFARFVWSEVTS